MQPTRDHHHVRVVVSPGVAVSFEELTDEDPSNGSNGSNASVEEIDIDSEEIEIEVERLVSLDDFDLFRFISIRFR